MNAFSSALIAEKPCFLSIGSLVDAQSGFSLPLAAKGGRSRSFEEDRNGMGPVHLASDWIFVID